MNIAKVQHQKATSHDSAFWGRAVELFTRQNAGHMGADMYHDHDGICVAERQPMSGVYLWGMHATHGTIPRVERHVFKATMKEIANVVGQGLPLVEFGPGTGEDTLTYANILGSRVYVPIDGSEGILDQVVTATMNRGLDTRPKIKDIFSGKNEAVIEEKSIGLFSGCTIGNTPGGVPKSEGELHAKVTHTFRSLSQLIGYGGYLAVSCRAEQDGRENERLYSERWHGLFGVNFLYRMQEELPVTGFNPELFVYQPVWHKEYSLLAHNICATENQTFLIGDTPITVKKGDLFHYNNSYNHPPSFLESCAKTAGLELNRRWSGECAVEVYLFNVPQQIEHKPAVAPRRRPSAALITARQ